MEKRLDIPSPHNYYVPMMSNRYSNRREANLKAMALVIANVAAAFAAIARIVEVF